MTVHSSSESGLIVTDVRKLIRGARIATLATLDHESGHPYASLISVATAMDCAPLFLISDLAVHTRNLKNDPRISILFSAESGVGQDPLNAGRVSVMGTAAATASAGVRSRFLARHPEAAFYADFADFAFYEMAVSHAHFVGGFGRIASVAASDILVSRTAAESWETGAEETLRDINVLTSLVKEHALAVACDPDGFDLTAGDTVTRVAFAERLVSPKDIAEAMRQIAP